MSQLTFDFTRDAGDPPKSNRSRRAYVPKGHRASSVKAEANFRARLEELGAVMLGAYVNNKTAVHVRCPAGHDCSPTPNAVSNGQGICRRCAGRDPAAAEEAFHSQLAEFGATLLEPCWLGSQAKHACRCRNGHLCYPRPSLLRQGQGPCLTCVGQNQDDCARAFRERLEVLGATQVGVYVNALTKVHVIDAAGHDCYPTPGGVQQGRGFCRICAKCDPGTSEARFRARLAELGATPLFTTWGGAGTPHDVLCAASHPCRPRPSDTLQGDGICRICAGKSTEVAEAKFRARLAELGAVLLEPWRNTSDPHKVQCSKGHIVSPRPSDILQGTGICRICKNTAWDAFYVVTSATVVKFGITSGDPRPRLREHAQDGLVEVVLLRAGLPELAAPETEDAVCSALALAGDQPVRGREYFDISCLALVLDVANSWLGAVA